MRRSLRCMAALLLMITILVSGGCQNMRHLSVSQSEKDDADTGTGYNIYYSNFALEKMPVHLENSIKTGNKIA